MSETTERPALPGSLNVKKVLKPVMAMTWMVTARHPLRGMCGGDDASPYSNRFLVGTPDEYQIELSTTAQLPADAVMAYQYGGGGGFYSPLLRDPAAVREDVLDEIVSLERAREKYGVVLKGGVWYVLGAVDGQIRTYRVSRVLAAEPLDTRSERPADFDLASHWAASSEAYERDAPTVDITVRLRPGRGGVAALPGLARAHAGRRRHRRARPRRGLRRDRRLPRGLPRPRLRRPPSP